MAEEKTQNILIGAGIVLLIVAGFFYFRSKNNPEEAITTSPEEVIVQEEGTVKKTGEAIQPMTEEEIKTMREEVDAVLSSGGETANVNDISGGQAKGEAKRAFSDGKFYYKLNLSGLKPLEKGFYYEGFLENETDSFSTGKIEVNENDEGILYYTASVDKSDYLKAIVTLEPEDGNPAPADHILEGEFLLNN